MAQVALITGAAQRIGAHLALELAKKGWDIALHFHGSEEDACLLSKEITSLGQRAELFACDFMDEAETSHLIARVVDEMGQLDCLINNASTFENDTALSVSRQSWNLHMEVNLRTPFVLMQSFAAYQMEQGRSGNIINMIDQRVWNLNPHFTSYTLSKAGLWTLTQTLAQAFAPNIRVNAIGPGPTLKNIRQSDEDFKAQYEAVPLKRQTDLLDISNAVVYILGAQSMTGQMIALDGGEHLGWAQGDNHTPPKE